ncbi:MAG: putative transport system ATP-binding protein [Chloroflexia bacterium]|nr:putative transport system ATP-binding protein [Chloroflexia bacterium]
MQQTLTVEQPLIIAENLEKHFMHNGHLVKAVDGVSFSLRARQMVAITGASGGGKSTLMHLLGALERPSGGKLVVDGVDLTSLSGNHEVEFRRNKVGFIFQAYQLIPNLTALENVMLPMEFAGRSSHEQTTRARDLLKLVGIEESRHSHRPGKLSGGQQQRVAIARALANDAPLILADEPTGNLDSKTGQRIIELLGALVRQQGKTVVLVTHERDIAQQADTSLEIEDGRIRSTLGMAARTTRV